MCMFDNIVRDKVGMSDLINYLCFELSSCVHISVALPYANTYTRTPMSLHPDVYNTVISTF